ncbi:MAG TPA: hypothetical protein VGX91_13735 [Candidatus Cybelea sp.]|jgi:hypothetical protein|nr:hypothetical protein [Candidatus Cybelea sp.]
MGDQSYQSSNVTGIYQVSIGADGATVAGSSGFSSQCDTAVANDFVQWAFDSAKPEDVPKAKAFQVTAGNEYCTDYYATWDYPQAGINPPVLTAGGNSIPVQAWGQTLTIYGK